MRSRTPGEETFPHGGDDPSQNESRRERKKARLRAHISDVATRLFTQYGFDAVSVSQIADAADVARPTVFAYFPRKEDLVFDRFADVTSAIVQTVRDSTSPVRAVLEALSAPDPPGGAGSSESDQFVFWRLVASSRALQARAQELAWQMERALSDALAERGVAEPDVCAALIAAAYRTVHLDTIRRLLAGESSDVVQAERTQRLNAAFEAVELATTRLGRLIATSPDLPPARRGSYRRRSRASPGQADRGC